MAESNRNEPFATLHHMCIVVRDVEKAVEFYQSIGIGPFFDYPPLDEFKTLGNLDREALLALKIKCAQLGPVQLQLLQPTTGETPQKRFLEERGEGVFHIGFVVDDIEEGEQKALERGLAVLMQGRRDNGSGFTYFEAQDKGGVTLSIRQSPPAS
jgi:catechol 2,3-dioxygenase-like lactoylglutathione lyase family enzyme